ncbi:hypothetical protein [Albibacterium indicum]|uniref:hypothetical protein n=1 Tax=Albibacterium indicum TaxID=2292082 RepID=UPI00130062D4|nr:hypothetical protein [Pedobacter indicus]
MKAPMILICLLCTLNVAHGQHQDVQERKTLRIKITVPAQNDFGDEHIEKVGFSLFGEKVSFVWVHPSMDDTAYLNREFLKDAFMKQMFFFDLGFEADSLVFAKKFPRITMPTLPNIEAYDQYQQKIVDSLYRLSSMDLYRDSTEYRFTPASQYSLKESRDALRKGGFGFGNPAGYLGDIQKLADDIAREVASSSFKVSFDSVLVFQSAVRRLDRLLEGGEIFELEGLIYGTPSFFSEIAAKHLQAEENRFFEDGGTKWRPAHGDLSRNTRVKIYVRLEQDGKVTIKLPKYLGNWTGD